MICKRCPLCGCQHNTKIGIARCLGIIEKNSLKYSIIKRLILHVRILFYNLMLPNISDIIIRRISVKIILAAFLFAGCSFHDDCKYEITRLQSELFDSNIEVETLQARLAECNFDSMLIVFEKQDEIYLSKEWISRQTMRDTVKLFFGYGKDTLDVIKLPVTQKERSGNK